jgi:hypothetical protein
MPAMKTLIGLIPIPPIPVGAGKVKLLRPANIIDF